MKATPPSPPLLLLIAAIILSVSTSLTAGFAPASSISKCSSLASYLDSLSGQQHANNGGGITLSYNPAPSFRPSSPLSPPTTVMEVAKTTAATPKKFRHASPQYFSLDNLASNGLRPSHDWGRPQDWSRTLLANTDDNDNDHEGVLTAGTWYCTEGGWKSTNAKSVTEVFYVLDGHGMLGDADGMRHYFGPGDLVVIPKGHTGRWDVNAPLHKLWAVNDHACIEESGPIIRVQVFHYKDFCPSESLVETATVTCGNDALYGSTGPVIISSSSSNVLYDVGPTQVGVWTCRHPGSFEVVPSRKGRWFHLLQGIMFLTNDSNGTSQRCVPGDTVLLPPGWSGLVDVLEPVKKIFTVSRL